MDEKELALVAIRKKLVGKNLTYKEIFAVMDEIAHNKLGDILTTYFAASGYAKGFSNEELYFLTRAMVETGEKITWHRKLVADKHSIGGVPGTRTTMIVVPIIAAAGFLIPKSSSRAITTPDGTADDMEVLSKVEFEKEQIQQIVKTTNGCIVWGGSFHIAPADDVLIHVESPLLFESYDKIIVSILAKKIAFGSTHIVIDIPYGTYVKVHTREEANILKEKFIEVAKRFDLELAVCIHETRQPAGRGIGPVLETKDALEVLEQTPDRPRDLEHHALTLATSLLELCLKDSPDIQQKVLHEFTTPLAWATHILSSGLALRKMKEIIAAQDGNPTVSCISLAQKLSPHHHEIKAQHTGEIKEIFCNNLTVIAKILGAPGEKGAGIYLNKKIGEVFAKGDTLFTLYGKSLYTIQEAVHSLKNFPILA